MIEVNFLAVLVAAVANMVIGTAWYSKRLFGEQWMKEAGIDPKKMNASGKQMGMIMFVALVSSLVSAYVLAHVSQLAVMADVGNAITTGFWMWLGFVTTTQIAVVLWEMKSVKLWLINTSYSLLSFLTMGAIIQLMG